MTRREFETRLLLWQLCDVLVQIGVHPLLFVESADDPWYLSDYTSELEWLDRHLVCDDEGVIIRVL